MVNAFSQSEDIFQGSWHIDDLGHIDLCVVLEKSILLSNMKAPQPHQNMLILIDGFGDTSFVYSRDLPPDFLEARRPLTLAGGKHIFCCDEVSGKTFGKKF